MSVDMLSQKLGKKASEVLDIPKDVCMNLPKIVLNGDVECFCSGCAAINKYTSEEIKLSAGGRVICIKGSKLLIKSIDDEEVTLAGKISAVELI